MINLIIKLKKFLKIKFFFYIIFYFKNNKFNIIIFININYIHHKILKNSIFELQ